MAGERVERCSLQTKSDQYFEIANVSLNLAGVGGIVNPPSHYMKLFVAILSLVILQEGYSGPTLAQPSQPSSNEATPTPPVTTPPPPTSSGNPVRTSPSPGNWVNVTSNLAGMASECGNMTYVSSKPSEDLVIAGVARQGLWASSDGGTSWHRLGTGAGSARIVNRTGSIVYDPAHPNVFWESGIYNSNGVYRSDDDGTTFSALGTIGHIDSVSVDFRIQIVKLS